MPLNICPTVSLPTKNAYKKTGRNNTVQIKFYQTENYLQTTTYKTLMISNRYFLYNPEITKS